MINCPNCRHPNLEGALICENCAQFLSEAHQTPLFTRKYNTSSLLKRNGYRLHIATDSIRLNLNAGTLYHTRGVLEHQRLILGRQQDAPNASMLPIQLHNAVELGVSRQHAALIPMPDGIGVQDLGSTNGTRLNGVVLEAGRTYRIADGDQLQLGQLLLEVHLE